MIFTSGLWENLVHPDWYAACFLGDPSNASMWASYADGHKGMCLKFSVGVAPSGAESLSLYQAVSMEVARATSGPTMDKAASV